jgi:hypothetical protein
MADGTQIRLTAVDQTTAAFRSVQGNISSLQNTLRGIAGPLAAAFSVAAITAFGKSLIDTADRIAEISQKTGVAAETLSSLSNAAKMNGVDMEGLGTAMVRLNKAISEAVSGSFEQQRAFSALGISAEELKNLSTEEVFYRISDAFSGAADGAAKTTIAMTLLGKSGADLIPTLNMGRSELQKFSATFSKDFTNAANEFNDNIDLIVQNIQKIGAAGLTPVLKELNKFILYLRGIAKLAEEKGFWRTLLGMTEIGEWLGLGLTDRVVQEVQKIEAAQNQAGNSAKKAGKNQLSLGETVEQANERLAQFADRNRMLAEVFKELDTPLDVLNRKIALYEQLLEDSLITQSMFSDLVFKAQNAFQDLQPKVELNDTALKRYIATIQDVRAALDNMAVRALANLENALLGVMTGTMSVKDAFKQMAISIIQDLIRIQIQQAITKPIGDAISAAGGFEKIFSNIFGGARAMGGTVQGNQAYMVGEKGAELFIPGKTGTVVPNNQLGGSGAVVNQTINISTGVSQTVRAEIVNMLPRIMESTKAAIADSKRRGGGFAKMMGT